MTSTRFVLVASLVLLVVAPALARVTKIVIDRTGSPAFAGRALGELDPGDARNAIIQAIGLARDADGNEVVAAGFLLPAAAELLVQPALASDVLNR